MSFIMKQTSTPAHLILTEGMALKLKETPATKFTINNVQCVKYPLTIIDGGWAKYRSGVNWQFCDHVPYLMGIFANVEVNASIFSGSNFCASTDESQIRTLAEIFRKDLDKAYHKTLDVMIEILVDKFGDGSVAFGLSLGDIKESFGDIELMISTAKAT